MLVHLNYASVDRQVGEVERHGSAFAGYYQGTKEILSPGVGRIVGEYHPVHPGRICTYVGLYLLHVWEFLQRLCHRLGEWHVVHAGARAKRAVGLRYAEFIEREGIDRSAISPHGVVTLHFGEVGLRDAVYHHLPRADA